VEQVTRLVLDFSRSHLRQIHEQDATWVS
jgi:hypothetical protein